MTEAHKAFLEALTYKAYEAFGSRFGYKEFLETNLIPLLEAGQAMAEAIDSINDGCPSKLLDAWDAALEPRP